MSLFEELIEYTKEDEKIVKSFQSNDSLSNEIFLKKNNGYEMIDDVRKKLLQISDDFTESLGVEFFIHDITLTGSLSNYNWSKYSDVDLHILVDMDEIIDNKNVKSEILKNIVKEFFDSKKNIWNQNHNIKIKNYEVEIYVQDVDEPHTSSGVYSILNNKWIVVPIKGTQKIDDRKILEKSEEFVKKIDLLCKKSNKKDIIPQIDNLRKKLKKFRQCGLKSSGEYSYENLVFKLLRRNGYIGKLLKLKNSITDRNLTIPQ